VIFSADMSRERTTAQSFAIRRAIARPPRRGRLGLRRSRRLICPAER